LRTHTTNINPEPYPIEASSNGRPEANIDSAEIHSASINLERTPPDIFLAEAAEKDASRIDF